MQPRRLDDEPVNLAQLGQIDPLPARPNAGLLDRLGVYPLRRLRVALDLEIRSQLLAPDRLPLGEQALDFPQDQRVSFDRRRVVGLLVPDPYPDRLRLQRKRQAADAVSVAPIVARSCRR